MDTFRGEEKFIFVDERWFRTYFRDALGYVNHCYDRRVLFGDQTDLLEVQKEMFEACKVVEKHRVVVGSNECTRCFEDYCSVYYVQVQI